MSTNVSTCHARPFHHASDIPDEVWAALRENEATANVILSFAEKAKLFLRGDDKDQLWIVLCDHTGRVEFVLSCTKGPLGNYPVFVVPSKVAAQRVQGDEHGEFLANSLVLLVRCLLDEVPAQRVFSVFSLTRVTEMFAEIFVAEAHARQEYGIQAINPPYYDATSAFCTRETLNESQRPASHFPESEDVTIHLGHANESHSDGIKVLCKAFSKTSPPYVLDDAGAKLEADMLIRNQQVWVHSVQKGDEKPEIACLVATTRESDNVMAVTKVFTAEQWRGRGCAARLLHRICQEILQKKQRAILYVGNSDELAPARKVYRKIGFQGLDEPLGQQVVEGVERWLEIGFEGTTLGYW